MIRAYSAVVTCGLLSVWCFSFSFAVAQEDPPAPEVGAEAVHVVDLEPTSEGRLGWSAKGIKVALQSEGERLSGSLLLGPQAAQAGGMTSNPPIRLALFATEAGGPMDRLWIDRNRDGSSQPDETLETQVKERNGKTWSSFSTVVELSVTAPDGTARVLPYPIHLWHVFDPSEPDAAPILRWSARGWMEGQFNAPGGAVTVVLAELELDGSYLPGDRWALGHTAKEAHAYAAFRDVQDHNWCGEEAWRVVDVHPSGLQVSLRRFDPGVSRAEELEARDRLSADKRAKRAAEPLAFLHDFETAEAAAKAAGQRLFLDFETTWCGPCKQMDALVYVAQDVVDAAGPTVCVKLDGDKEKALVKRFQVGAYPTLILLGSDGKEIRRAVGYQSVAQMKAFFE